MAEVDVVWSERRSERREGIQRGSSDERIASETLGHDRCG